MSGKDLASALTKMATSPVKADRDAIARLERECATDITKITTALDESEIFMQVYQVPPNTHEKTSKILVSGLFWSAVIGILTMFVRPSYAWCGVTLGFVAGSTSRAMKY